MWGLLRGSHVAGSDSGVLAREAAPLIAQRWLGSAMDSNISNGGVHESARGGAGWVQRACRQA